MLETFQAGSISGCISTRWTSKPVERTSRTAVRMGFLQRRGLSMEKNLWNTRNRRDSPVVECAIHTLRVLIIRFDGQHDGEFMLFHLFDP
jgi:hypothetical protein